MKKIIKCAIGLLVASWLPVLAMGNAFADPLNYGDGKVYGTNVYRVRLIGILPVPNAEPFLVFSGFGCDECDINKEIFIQSPSLPVLTRGELSPRFSYPGRYFSGETSEMADFVRVFYGRCVAGADTTVVWLRSTLDDTSLWRADAFYVSVVDGALKIYTAGDYERFKVDVLESMASGTCQEIHGEDFYLPP